MRSAELLPPVLAGQLARDFDGGVSHEVFRAAGIGSLDEVEPHVPRGFRLRRRWSRERQRRVWTNDDALLMMTYDDGLLVVEEFLTEGSFHEHLSECAEFYAALSRAL